MSDAFGFGNNKKTSTIYYADDGSEKYPALNETKYDSANKDGITRQDSTKYTSIQLAPETKVVYEYIDMSQSDVNRVSPKKSGLYVFVRRDAGDTGYEYTEYNGVRKGSPKALKLCEREGASYSAVSNPTGSPADHLWYVMEDNLYVLTTDTEVVAGTTYYHLDCYYVETKDPQFEEGKKYYQPEKSQDEVVNGIFDYYRKQTHLDNVTGEKAIDLGNLTLPEGTYILTVKQYCDKLKTCSLCKDDDAIEPMNARDNSTDISSQQVHYFLIVSNGEEHSYKIKYEWMTYDDMYERVTPVAGDNPALSGWYEKNQYDEYYLSSDQAVVDSHTYYQEVQASKVAVAVSDKSKIDLEPVIKVRLDQGYYTNEKVKAKIQELDYKKAFNYAYQVPENILIEDPLDSQSFFDENHIYNQFILPQISTTVIRDVR